VRARAALPGLAVTTDVIAGFPGESDEDFADTLRFVESCGFTGLHVFRYSSRARTPAASAPGQVPPPVRSARAAALRALHGRLAAAHLAARVGGEASVLVERVTGDEVVGTSEDHLRVRLRVAKGTGTGDIVRVRITGARGGVAEGLLLTP
jgi:threonylcarbamoyladenosine tRNA methylthiotransferase MtaB